MGWLVNHCGQSASHVIAGEFGKTASMSCHEGGADVPERVSYIRLPPQSALSFGLGPGTSKTSKALEADWFLRAQVRRVADDATSRRPLTGSRRPCASCPTGAIAGRGNPYINLSRVIGRSRMRLPVALKTALATAAPTPVMPISPTPRAPIGVWGSGMSVHITSISGTSICTGT